MTRSKARSLRIDVNKLENDVSSMKGKSSFDDRKEATKRVKLEKNSSIGLPAEKTSISTGEADKKRKVYKNLLVFNSESNSAQTTIENQSNCPPPIAQIAPLKPTQNAVVKIEFRIGEVVWAKIKCFPAWPAKIKSAVSSKMVLVVWFNDYRVTKVYKTQLFKFLLNFDTFAKNFDNSIGLKTAAREALMYFGNSALYQDKL